MGLVCGALLAPGCRTQEAQSPDTEPGEEPGSLDEAAEDEAGAEDEAAGATSEDGLQNEDSEQEEPSIEEQLALDAMREALSSTSDETEAAAEPLSFRVIQQGPQQPWIMGVVNKSDGHAWLIADPRLIAFDVSVPGKKKSVTCTLPDSLRPARAQRRYGVWLAPGQGVVKAFDPRLYCFASSGQQVLVPGAIVSARFGWPEKVKTIWKGGKQQRVVVEQSEPFVARIPNQEAPPTTSQDPENEADLVDAEGEPARRIKELKAQPLALDSRYKEWSRVGLKSERRKRSPILIDMKQGSDAHSQLSATVAITLKNRAKRTHYVYFRRELLSFEVMGPGGLVSCDPQPDTRAPDRQAFLRLSPGRSMTITSRLVELCPKGTFSRPGFYLVHARFDADDSGEEFGLDAYVGRVASETPANVRIRTGELELEDKQAMRALQIIE